MVNEILEYRKKKQSRLNHASQETVFLRVVTDPKSNTVQVEHVCMCCQQMSKEIIFNRSLALCYCLSCEKTRILDIRAMKRWAFNRSAEKNGHLKDNGPELVPAIDPYCGIRM